jgi:hypothetical protein
MFLQLTYLLLQLLLLILDLSMLSKHLLVLHRKLLVLLNLAHQFLLQRRDLLVQNPNLIDVCLLDRVHMVGTQLQRSMLLDLVIYGYLLSKLV